MAIRHGHGKIVTDGLVFAYDTGDKVNSYKGRPTTNVAPYISTHGTSNFELPSLPPGVTTIHSKGAIINGTLNWRDLFQTSGFSIPAGERLVVSAWVYIPADKVNNRFNINVDINGNNTGLAGWHDLTAGQWHKLRGSWLNNTGATANAGYTRLEPFTPAEWTGGTNTAYAINFMVETGPFSSSYIGSQALPANTTRSATEGLLDLTGNNTVDISNVSFDSNAELTFDGTDDYTETPDSSLLDLTTDISFEFVVNADSSQGNPYPRLIDKSVYLVHLSQYPPFSIAQNINTSAGLRQVGVGSAFQADTPTHIVTTYDGQVGKIYVNGNLINTKDFGSILPCNSNGGTLKVGGASGRTLNGSLPVAKVYNKVLTIEEVRQNFNHYKGRFDL